jgi:hypothetical protein
MGESARYHWPVGAPAGVDADMTGIIILRLTVEVPDDAHVDQILDMADVLRHDLEKVSMTMDDHGGIFDIRRVVVDQSVYRHGGL